MQNCEVCGVRNNDLWKGEEIGFPITKLRGNRVDFSYKFDKSLGILVLQNDKRLVEVFSDFKKGICYECVKDILNELKKADEKEEKKK